MGVVFKLVILKLWGVTTGQVQGNYENIILQFLLVTVNERFESETNDYCGDET
jgi:hypothetical protein